MSTADTAIAPTPGCPALRIASCIAASVRLDHDHRDRVPLEGAVGLRLLGRNREHRDLEALDLHVEGRPRGGRHQRVTSSFSLPLIDWRTIRLAAGSPFRSAWAMPFAWSIMMCGGSGGASGSGIASETTGRAAAG